MDEATFQKELLKYKIIRPPDYIKLKSKTKSTNKTKSIVHNIAGKNDNPILIDSNKESNFWELLSTTNSSILTTVESIKFIEALKQVI